MCNASPDRVAARSRRQQTQLIAFARRQTRLPACQGSLTRHYDARRTRGGGWGSAGELDPVSISGRLPSPEPISQHNHRSSFHQEFPARLHSTLLSLCHGRPGFSACTRNLSYSRPYQFCPRNQFIPPQRTPSASFGRTRGTAAFSHDPLRRRWVRCQQSRQSPAAWLKRLTLIRGPVTCPTMEHSDMITAPGMSACALLATVRRQQRVVQSSNDNDIGSKQPPPDPTRPALVLTKNNDDDDTDSERKFHESRCHTNSQIPIYTSTFCLRCVACSTAYSTIINEPPDGAPCDVAACTSDQS
ncbi:hypothetical protein BC629DRAFT_11730 [Irpex lacteus]|nr:hypothetical protein BC629DRAFT_11730 [Irpex lacteus]